MKKRFLTALAIAATALWLGTMPAAAQGRGQGQGQTRGQGAGAAATHEPMGMGHAMGNSNSTTAAGPKSADQLLMQNSKLSSMLAPLVGCTGTDTSACVQAQAAKFTKLGQFVSAAHVSHNLNIPFACLASDLTGDPTLADFVPAGGTTPTCPAGTGSSKMSLGKAIQANQPTTGRSQANAAVKTANKQAKNDINGKS